MKVLKWRLEENRKKKKIGPKADWKSVASDLP